MENTGLTQWLAETHLLGVVIGTATFIIIGLFHPLVIKSEYYFGTRCWWWYLVAGIAALAASVAVDDVMVSSMLGVVAFSSLWSIGEVFEQRRRVERGWFPRRPDKNSDGPSDVNK